MEPLENAVMNKELRKAQSVLAVSGRGVIYFSAWSFIKMLILFVYGSGLTMLREELAHKDTATHVFADVCLMMFALLYVWFHFYIGMNALGEGRGEVRKRLYIICAVILLMFVVIDAVAQAASWCVDKKMIYHLGSVVVDVTFMVALVDLIRAGITVRKCRRAKASEKV